MEKIFNAFNKIPHDKALHALTGCIFFMVMNAVLACFLPYGIASLFALGTTAMVAGAKEGIYDRSMPETHTVDMMDMVATICGGLLGYGCVLPYLISRYI